MKYKATGQNAFHSINVTCAFLVQVLTCITNIPFNESQLRWLLLCLPACYNSIGDSLWQAVFQPSLCSPRNHPGGPYRINYVCCKMVMKSQLITCIFVVCQPLHKLQQCATLDLWNCRGTAFTFLKHNVVLTVLFCKPVTSDILQE